VRACCSAAAGFGVMREMEGHWGADIYTTVQVYNGNNVGDGVLQWK
jgi:hypothetical protein